jgi:hypothetical protein
VVRGRKGEKEMSGKLISDSTLDHVKRLRNDCTKISEDRHQQSLKCKESNLHLATLSMVESNMVKLLQLLRK